MIYGTAGYTAISVYEKHGISPEQGEIVVTGSTEVLEALYCFFQLNDSTGKSSETDF